MDGGTVAIILFLAAQTAAGLIWGSRINTLVMLYGPEIKQLREARHTHSNKLTEHDSTLEDHEGRMDTLHQDFRGVLGIREVR